MDRGKSQEDIAPEDWLPVDAAPIVPGKSPIAVAAPPTAQALPPALGNYFAGSLSSDIQHDGLFVKTGYQTQSAERTPLMPVGPQGNAQNNVASQTVIVNQGGTTVITGLDFSGTWNAFTNYKPDDIVQYVGNLYICTSANTNLTPNTNPSFWTLFAQQSAVTSVALTMPSIFAVGGSPVTSTGTLAVTLATQTANTIFAGPSAGLAAIPTFRVLVVADLPALAASNLTNGTIGSGAIVLAVSPTLTGTVGLPIVTLTGKVTNYNSIATVDNGLPSELGHADLTAQTAAKTATTLYLPTATGRYRISAYIKVTTVASVSSVLGPVTITFTDGTDSVAQSCVMLMASEAGAAVTTNTGNATTSVLTGTMFIYAKTGVAIQYAIAYTSVNAAEMVYAARLTCEAM